MMLTMCENTNLKAKNVKFGDVQVVHWPQAALAACETGPEYDRLDWV